MRQFFDRNLQLVRLFAVYSPESTFWSLKDAHDVYAKVSNTSTTIPEIVAAMTVIWKEKDAVHNYISVMTTLTEHLRIRLSDHDQFE